MDENAVVGSRFGDWEVRVFISGHLGLDGGSMFGAVPRVMWERLIAPDEAHRIPLAMRLVLLRHASGNRNVLIDTGIGDKFDSRFADMFAVRNPAARDGRTPLESAVAAAGCPPEEISDVILTHLHFDHGGGVSRRRDGEIVPTFPHARHYLQRANLELARDPNPRERASYLRENVDPLAQTDLQVLEGEAELMPGVSVIPFDGHTAGMQVVRIEGGGSVLYFVADLAPTRHHVRIPFTMGYDLCPRLIMEEKRRLWDQAIEEEAIIVFEHDPETAAGTIEQRNGRYQLAKALRFTESEE